MYTLANKHVSAQRYYYLFAFCKVLSCKIKTKICWDYNTTKMKIAECGCHPITKNLQKYILFINN